MFERKRFWRALVLGLAMANTLSALPLPNPTSLPYPINATEDEKDMIKEVLNLQVYPDGDNGDHFYFLPPWQVRQYTHGAATMLLNSPLIGYYNEAQRLLKKKETYSAEKLEAMGAALARDQLQLVELEKRYQEAVEKNLELLIVHLGKRVATATAKFEADTKAYLDAEKIVKDGGTLLPEGIRRELNQAAARYMGMGGHQLVYDETNRQGSDTKINEGMHIFSNADGGYLNVNVYAGFSAKQLAALQLYKAKYFPHLKIILMPLEEISFFPLFDVYGSGHSHKSQFFKSLRGAGDYLGASVAITTSLMGSVAMAAHLGPFNLPLGIRAKFKFQTQPIDINLDCDFSKEFSIEGRETVRNGVYIFDGPMNLFLMNRENNNNLCNIKVNRGDETSAEYYVAKTIEQQILDLGGTLTVLNTDERLAYSKIMQKGLNRPYIPFRYWRTDENGRYMPLPPGIVGSYYLAPEWFFQAKKNEAANISRLKLKKHIYIDGQQEVIENLPVNLCLVFNPDRQAYDRCEEIEGKSAQSMKASADEALSSPECKDVHNAIECGKLRDKAGSLSNITRRFESHTFTNEI